MTANSAKHILIVDDDDMLRSYVKELLKLNNYIVSEAADGKEGLREFKENTPDLVITDIIMPDKEGLEIILEMKKKRPEVKIIAISGGGRISPDSYLECAAHFGASRIFQKPFKQKEIITAVKELIEQ